MQPQALSSVDAKAGMAERYHQVLPLLLAMPAEKLPRINLNVIDAVVTVLGLLPKLRDRLVQALPEFNPESASAAAPPAPTPVASAQASCVRPACDWRDQPSGSAGPPRPVATPGN